MSVSAIMELPSEVGHGTCQATPLVVNVPAPQEDYYSFGQHLKTDYEEVFVEPRHYEDTATGRALAPCVKTAAKAAFENLQAVVYYSFVFLIGIILSPVWGLVYAISSFVIVWALQPSIKLALMWLKLVSVLLRAAIRTALDPVFESCGNIFSRAAGNFSVRVKGLPERGGVSTI